MALFRKTKQTSDISVGRRRPFQDGDDQSRPGGTIFSYHSQRSNISNNLGRRETVEPVQVSRGLLGSMARHRILAAVVIVVGAALLLYISTLSTMPRVVLLQDQTTDYFLQSDDVYARTAQESLEKSLFNRNKLTIDAAAVRADLLKNYPEIKNVSVALPILGHHPQVYIEPYKPSFILTTTSGSAFLLDATGRALTNTSQIPDISKLGVPTLQDKTGTEVKLGSRALPSTTVTFVQDVVKALKAKNVAISTLSLPPAAYQLDVAIAGQPYYVKFNLENDALQQAGTYLAVRNRLKTDKVTPSQYVDVRVPDRAYYK